jgi:hypothetical protein
MLKEVSNGDDCLPIGMQNKVEDKVVDVDSVWLRGAPTRQDSEERVQRERVDLNVAILRA